MMFTTHTVISEDGTVIGFRQTGSGPGLIICHGAGRISQLVSVKKQWPFH